MGGGGNYYYIFFFIKVAFFAHLKSLLGIRYVKWHILSPYSPPPPRFLFLLLSDQRDGGGQNAWVLVLPLPNKPLAVV